MSLPPVKAPPALPVLPVATPTALPRTVLPATAPSVVSDLDAILKRTDVLFACLRERDGVHHVAIWHQKPNDWCRGEGPTLAAAVQDYKDRRTTR